MAKFFEAPVDVIARARLEICSASRSGLLGQRLLWVDEYDQNVFQANPDNKYVIYNGDLGLAPTNNELFYVWWAYNFEFGGESGSYPKGLNPPLSPERVSFGVGLAEDGYASLLSIDATRGKRACATSCPIEVAGRRFVVKGGCSFKK